jgi:hypothetical protein
MKTGLRYRVHKLTCLLKSDPAFIALLTPADLWVTPQGYMGLFRYTVVDN